MNVEFAKAALTGDERRRLEDCGREPIRTPGAIQSHGALIGLDCRTFVVECASENCPEILGIDVSVLGRTLAEVAGEDFDWAVRAFVADGRASNPLSLRTESRSFDAIIHEVGDFIIVELEPVLSSPLQPLTSALYALIQRIAQSTDIDALRTAVARELRALTGFDRVMLYHFHQDGHGEVVAEDRAEDMEPYLGLHFPASDIPTQARELYLTKLSRAIVGTSGETSDLLFGDGTTVAAALDLSNAELRSVSPHHLQFMRNMGQDSTVSFSLVRDGVLIGMITCAHRSNLRLPFIIRKGVEVLASQVALQVSALDQMQQLRRQAAVQRERATLMAQIADTEEIAESLVRGEKTLLDLIPADGVAVCVDGRTRTRGSVPPTAELEALLRHTQSQSIGAVFHTGGLSVEHPGLTALTPSITGALVVSIGGAGDFLAFFRNEVLRTVDWLGDQTTANRRTPLSPRNSFSSWSESVTGTANSWDEFVEESAELAKDLESALLRRVESQLADLAMRDALTGLPNRRRLMEELDATLREPHPDDDMSLLFIDLDGFKEVNDAYGHDVGDALLAAVGNRILHATRADDVVARLGGDEFVVLCHGVGHEKADVIAERILAAIKKPIVLGGVPICITASVGTSTADANFIGADITGDDFLRRADQAMYRAKAAGRSRTAR